MLFRLELYRLQLEVVGSSPMQGIELHGLVHGKLTRSILAPVSKSAS